MPYAYHRRFNPNAPTPATGEGAVGDRADAATYIFDEDATLAVNIALATGRPILVRGPSGVGKSALARAVARQLGWSYVQAVVTSRTQARDLLWQVDQLRRLQDAQLNRLSADEAPYVTPGPLFWAFDPVAARNLLERTGRPTLVPPEVCAGAPNTVVLVDEIDKADPDVPNNLLEALGSLAFTIEELSLRVAAAANPPLVIVTTNEERDLPPAFVRRCVALYISPADADRLAAIAAVHLPAMDRALVAAVARHVAERGEETGIPASTAEFLDTLRACRDLGVAPGEAGFDQLVRMTLWKAGGPDSLV
ncbi:AAA family ATPase [Dankookia rubra]|nr:MoxR family ATPase [Dankookia rubra]